MVKVDAPEGYVLTGESQSNLSHSGVGQAGQTQAGRQSLSKTGDKRTDASEEAFDEIDSLLSGKPVARQTTAGHPSVRKTAPTPQPTSPHPSRQVVVGQSRKQHPPSTEKPGTSPVLPDGQWEGRQSKLRQKWLLLIFGLLTVMITATILVVALVTNLFSTPDVASGDQPTGIAETNADENSTTLQPTENQSNEIADSSKNSLTNDNATTELTDSTSGADPNSVGENPATVDSAVEDAVGDTTEETVTDAGDGAAVEADESSLPLDSPGKDNGLLLPGIKDPGNGFAELDEKPKSIFDGLSFVEELLENDEANIDLLSQMRKDQRIEQAGISRFYVAKPDSLELNIEKQLNLIIHGLKTETTLGGFVNRIFLISRVPVTIDVESLSAIGIDPLKKYAILETELSTQQLLEKLAASAGMQMVPSATGGILVAQGADDMVQQPYDIPGSDQFSEEDFQGMVDSIKFSLSPLSWQTSNSDDPVSEESDLTESEIPLAKITDGRLIVRQKNRVHWQIEQLLSKFAAALTLKTNSSDPAALQVTTNAFEHFSMLDSIKLQTGWLLPQRLTKILDTLEQENGVTVLVDWESLAKVGWNPEVVVLGTQKVGRLKRCWTTWRTQ